MRVEEQAVGLPKGSGSARLDSEVRVRARCDLSFSWMQQHFPESSWQGLF